MLTLTQHYKVKELLKTYRYSDREIASELSVSVHEVRGVAETIENIFPDRNRKPVRCPKCGAKVHLPCLACRVRQYRELSKEL